MLSLAVDPNANCSHNVFCLLKVSIVLRFLQPSQPTAFHPFCNSMSNPQCLMLMLLRLYWLSVPEYLEFKLCIVMHYVYIRLV